MTHPNTIDSGHGEELTFHGVEQGEDGPRVKLSGRVQPGSGPPMHTHLRQAEHLEVVRGQLWYQVQGEEPRVLGPGESVTFAAGQPHTFKAHGDEVLECVGWVSPPDNNEYFLTQIYDSARRNQAGGRPDDFDVAFLLHRYRREYAMPEIPTPVQKLVFPVLRLLGTLSGKYRRYADAPPPVA